MLSKNQIKRITSLGQKKFRKQEQLFVAEGVKVITELLDSSFELAHLYHTKEVQFAISGEEVTDADLRKVSFLKTPQKALALFKMPVVSNTLSRKRVQLLLDDVRDPGNLGTIIRLCDWFGVTDLICSIGTVDCYNPKVVQATMGSLTRVNVQYTSLVAYLAEEQRPVYGTFMDGANIYGDNALSEDAVIVMGNEGKGISEAVAQFVTRRIAIPRFGESPQTESLNVATATAITLSEFRRAAFTEK